MTLSKTKLFALAFLLAAVLLPSLSWAASSQSANDFISGNKQGDDAENKDKCFVGQNKQRYCIRDTDAGRTVVYANKGDVFLSSFYGCTVLPVKLYEHKECFFCPLFEVIFNAVESMAKRSFEALGSAFAKLIIVAMALWLSLQVLTHVSALTKQDAPKFLVNIMTKTFIFLAAYLLLTNPTEIYRIFINPVLVSGLKMAQELLPNTSYGSISVGSAAAAGGEYFSQNTYQQLENFIKKVQENIATMTAIGTSLICVGVNEIKGLSGTYDFARGFKMIIQGATFAVFGLLLSLAFGFYIIDAVLQLGILGALMPFLVASFAFGPTRGYTKQGVTFLMNSFFVFVFVGLTVSVALLLVGEAVKHTADDVNLADVKCDVDRSMRENAVNSVIDLLNGGPLERALEECKTETDKEKCRKKVLSAVSPLKNIADQLRRYKTIDAFFRGLEDLLSKAARDRHKQQDEAAKAREEFNAAAGASDGLDIFWNAINMQCYGQLVAMTDVTSLNFLLLIVACIFGFKFIGKSTELAGQMSGGAISGIGNKVGGMAASAVKGAAKKVGGAAKKGVTGAIDAAKSALKK